MNAEPMQDALAETRSARKPRLMLMGEFSAGKSTLANLLLGSSMSQVRVTATQMPPIWYCHGAPGAVHVDADGHETRIGIEDLSLAEPGDTRFITVRLPAEVLEFCDLIDMPGTSDPNMNHNLWEDLVSRADGAIWCTPSTQAWRQSEAAIWEQMPPAFHSDSLLLITRMDKLLTDRDRDRVTARVRREVDGAFRQVLPISLTQALAAGEDDAALDLCGATDFVDHLIALVEGLAPRVVDDTPDKIPDGAPASAAAGPGDRDGAAETANAAANRPEAAIAAIWDGPEGDQSADDPSPGSCGDMTDDEDTLSLFADDRTDEDPAADPAPDAGHKPARQGCEPDGIAPRRVLRDQSRRVRTRPRTAPSAF
ncbi:MAG: dynamin family protein [Marinibacterium sp.]